MKKIFLLYVIMIFSISTFAQSKNDKSSGISFGAKVGWGSATTSGEPQSGIFKQKVETFYIGGTVNIPLAEMFSVQSGLTLISKGFKSSAYGDALARLSAGASLIAGTPINFTSFDVRYNPWYLEVPVNAIVNFEVGSDKVLVGAGPYIGFGLFGKQTASGTLNETAYNESSDIKFGSSSTNDLKAIDFGLNFLLGYQLSNGLSANACYGLGLSPIGTADGSSSKNRVFSIGVGIAF